MSRQKTLQILERMGIQTRLGVEGPSLLSIRGHCSQYYGWGFRAQGTEGGPEPPSGRKKGQGRKHLSVPGSGSQG